MMEDTAINGRYSIMFRTIVLFRKWNSPFTCGARTSARLLSLCFDLAALIPSVSNHDGGHRHQRHYSPHVPTNRIVPKVEQPLHLWRTNERQAAFIVF